MGAEQSAIAEPVAEPVASEKEAYAIRSPLENDLKSADPKAEHKPYRKPMRSDEERLADLAALVRATGDGHSFSSNATQPQLSIPSPSSDTSKRSGDTNSAPSWRLLNTFVSYRPAGLAGVGTRSTRKHTDPKQVEEGLEGLSLQCALGQPEQLRSMLKSKWPVDTRDFDGDRVALHWAAARGDLKCLELLLKAGADASITDAHGRTPAELAHETGQPAAADLLKRGTPMADSKSVYDGLQHVSVVTALNEPSQLKQLLAHGGSDAANACDDDGDRYPLHWAAARGSLRCASLLLAAGADVTVTDAAGRTPMELALLHNHHAALQVLSQHDGSDVGDKGSASAAVARQAEERRKQGVADGSEVLQHV